MTLYDVSPLTSGHDLSRTHHWNAIKVTYLCLSHQDDHFETKLDYIPITLKNDLINIHRYANDQITIILDILLVYCYIMINQEDVLAYHK